MAKISSYLQKPNWRRRTPRGQWEELTQDDFLNDYYPTSHKINDTTYKTMRPIWEYKEGADGKEGEWVITDFAEVERVAIGLEQVVCRSLPVNMFGNNIWFGNEGDEDADEMLEALVSHWNITGMKDAVIDWYGDAGAVGDAGLYIYITEDGTIGYKVFSKLKGDDIYKPNKNTFVRKYTVFGADIVEIYTNEKIEVLVNGGNVSEDKREVIELHLGLGTINWENGADEEGYVKVFEKKNGRGFCPVAYIRMPDVLYGQGVSLRERIEKILSRLGDSNNAFGTPILVVNSPTISLPSMESAEKVIGMSDKDGKAELLSPPDVSSAFTTDLKENEKQWQRVTGLVLIDPEALKGGDYSGAYLNNLYFPTVVWCIKELARIRGELNEVIGVFKNAVGLVEKKSVEFGSLVVSWEVEPYTPKNKLEEMTILTMGVGAKIISRKTASKELAISNAHEEKRLKEQMKYDAKLGQKTTDLKVDNNLE